jgi:Family of unknown function (DUF6232)
MSGTEEKVFLAEQGVTVTTTRFVVPSQIFTMSGVASVTFSKINPNRLFPIALIVIGLLVLVSGKGSIWHVVMFLLPGVAWLALQRPKFAVVLSSASGESRALVSKDQEFVRRVVSALNDAIIARG